MKIELCERTERHVRIYFEKAQDPEIRAVLPQRAATVEMALDDYDRSVREDSGSYGKTIYADGVYVGDIWCYGLRDEDGPDAMVSYCIFEKACWNQGVATEALRCFLGEISGKFGIGSVGAFTYAVNRASLTVLLKNGFCEQERFMENGVESVFCFLDICGEN